MNALICCGLKSLPSTVSFQLVSPMCRLTERIVRSALVTAWRLATSPTRTSPFLAKATTDGVVRDPSALAMTVGSPPSRTLTTEFVVPRSMPTARAMCAPDVGIVQIESVGRNFIVSRHNRQAEDPIPALPAPPGVRSRHAAGPDSSPAADAAEPSPRAGRRDGPAHPGGRASRGPWADRADCAGRCRAGGTRARAHRFLTRLQV